MSEKNEIYNSPNTQNGFRKLLRISHKSRNLKGSKAKHCAMKYHHLMKKGKMKGVISLSQKTQRS